MSDNSKNVYIEDNHIYLSVRKLKELLGDVELYNDEYKNKGEDSTKCHVQVGNEYTSFISNSPVIWPWLKTKTLSDRPSNSGISEEIIMMAFPCALNSFIKS